MWSAKMSPGAGASSAADPRLLRLQRAGRRKLTPRCVLEASLDWICSLASPSGVAYLVSLLCMITQTICIDAFLITYMSSAILLTLAIEIPLLVHLAIYWREESAHRSAPSEWLAYSWVHAAKVVVLFCRVMPRLPSPSDVREESADLTGHYSFWGINFDQLFTPTMLANLLLITPVFYALLMFRTSKAIFGKITHRITVDLILHYDMLWHVVIDMVDQVDMFHYARLPEVESTAWLDGQNKEALVRIQTVIPVFLFLSMVLQAQAFPGVVVDRWKLPEPALAREQDQQESVVAREGSRPPAARASSSSRPRRPMATLRERSFTYESGGPEAARAPSPRSEPLAPPPPPAPAFLQPSGLLAGPPLPPAGQAPTLAVRVQSPISPSPAVPPPGASPPSAVHRADTVGTEHSLDVLDEHMRGMDSASMSERLSRRSRLSDLGPLPSQRVSLGSRRLHMSPTWSSHSHQPLGHSASASRRQGHAGGGEVMSRERYLRLEKDRRRRLLDIINAIHRQNIIIARKRSAMISIFFTDIPFLTIRLWLWILLGNKYFPGLGVKNAICIILNGMQATLVRFADRAAFRDIQAQMVQYRVRFVGAGPTAGSQSSPDGEHPSPGVDSCPVPLTPSDMTATSAFSTPQTVPAEERGRPAATAAQSNWRRTYMDAERTVTRETVRSTGVCVHFWSLLLAFGAGFILAKGEHFIATFIAWVQNRDPNAAPAL